MNKIAVIGLGNISKRHRANLKLLYPEAIILAVSASGRLPREEVDNADTCLTSIEELLQHEIDMAIVASPATFHAQHAIPLLKSGIPVLIEKPLTASRADAEAIATAVKETGTPVAVGYCLRYLSSGQKLKKILEKGLLGDVHNVFVETGQYLPDWRNGKDYRDTVSANAELGGGALLELSHELDYAQWLFGELTPHSAILRSSKELDLEVEDSADILAANDVGIVVSIHLDFLQRKARRVCRVIGSKGSVEWDLLENKTVLFTGNDEKVVFVEDDWDKNGMYLRMLEDFKNKIDGKENKCITLFEAQKTVIFIEKIRKLDFKRL